MDERERADILAEILNERLPSVRHILDEWSVPESDALNYAQAKDLIWQLAAPLCLSMLGFSAAEHAHQEDPGDPDLARDQVQFARVGEDVADLLNRFIAIAAGVRP